MTDKKQFSIKDTLQSLFTKRRNKSRESGISGPSNVKRVMHITFDRQSQVFNGIPTQWQNAFTPKTSEFDGSEADCKSKEDYNVNVGNDSTTEKPKVLTSSQPVPEVSDTTSPGSRQEIVSEIFQDETPVLQPVSARVDTVDNNHPIFERQNTLEILSVTYDRDLGKFVNFPSHWQERLDRNSLLHSEFEKDPDMLVKIFNLMDEELEQMISEGSVSAASTASKPIFYEIQADKSNSSSELELDNVCYSTKEPAFQHQMSEEFPTRSSLVTVRAVQLSPDDDPESSCF